MCCFSPCFLFSNALWTLRCLESVQPHASNVSQIPPLYSVKVQSSGQTEAPSGFHMEEGQLCYIHNHNSPLKNTTSEVIHEPLPSMPKIPLCTPRYVTKTIQARRRLFSRSHLCILLKPPFFALKQSSRSEGKFFSNEFQVQCA